MYTVKQLHRMARLFILLMWVLAVCELVSLALVYLTYTAVAAW